MLFPQVLAGIYPIAQIQEPYTSVGYLASRIPVQALLHLRHPEAEDPSAEHPWCAWDVCEGGLPGFSFVSRLLCPLRPESGLKEGVACFAPKFLYHHQELLPGLSGTLGRLGVGLTGLEPGFGRPLLLFFSL